MKFFSTSPSVNLSFDLAAVNGFGPGVGNTCSPNPPIGSSCSPTGFGGSPFILTSSSATSTSVTLLAHGTIYDFGDNTLSIWQGSFTTQINNLTPQQIEVIINSAGPNNTITSSFSGEFDVAQAPEPASIALIGCGLMALVTIKRRKRVRPTSKCVQLTSR